MSDPSNEAVPLIAVRVFGLSGRGTDVSVVTSGPKGSLGTLHPVHLLLASLSLWPLITFMSDYFLFYSMYATVLVLNKSHSVTSLLCCIYHSI